MYLILFLTINKKKNKTRLHTAYSCILSTIMVKIRVGKIYCMRCRKPTSNKNLFLARRNQAGAKCGICGVQKRRYISIPTSR